MKFVKISATKTKLPKELDSKFPIDYFPGVNQKAVNQLFQKLKEFRKNENN